MSSAESNGPQPLLSLKSVSAGYGAIQVLNDISLTVFPGEIVTLIGANGAGKSTLLMTICGLHTRQGHIFFKGRDITALPTYKIARLGIAQVPEGRRVFPQMTVQENLAMGKVAAVVKNESLLGDVFRLFPILQERAQQRAGTLSGGEQQMLAIGRALMAQPQLLLLDEPSLGLAPQMMSRIFATLRTIAQGGMTIFLVEQNAHQALQLADRGYVLANGRMILEGRGADLLQNPAVRKAYLGGH